MSWGCGGGASDQAAQVERGLRPALVLEGSEPGPWTLGERMSHYGVAAASVAVVDQGELLWSHSYELSASDELTRSDGERLFAAGSLSRAVLGPAVMLLVQRGILALEEDLRERLQLEDRERPQDGVAAGVPLTLERALVETSGLAPVDLRGLADESAALAALRIEQRPGLRRRSSQAESLVLQRLAEEAIGSTDFQTAMTDLLFEPIGMRRSRFQSGRGRDTVGPHGRWGEREIEPPALADWQLGHLGLWTTAEDLARLALELMRSTDSSSAVFERETGNEILDPRLGSQAIGFEVWAGGRRFGRAESDALLDFDVESRSGAVILTSGGQGLALARELYRSLALSYDWSGGEPEVLESSPVSPSVARSVMGRYQTDDGRFQIVEDGGQLTLTAEEKVLLPGQVSEALHQVAGGFRMLGLPFLELHVDRNTQARVRGMELVFGRGIERFDSTSSQRYGRKLGVSEETLVSDEEGLSD